MWVQLKVPLHREGISRGIFIMNVRHDPISKYHKNPYGLQKMHYQSK